MRFSLVYPLLVLVFIGQPLCAKAQVSGEIDPTFKTSKSFGPDVYDSYFSRLKSLPDGKLLFSGSFQFFSEFRSSGLVRLMPDAEVDTSFRVTLTGCWLNGFEVMGNGKILVWGSISISPNGPAFGVVRLHANGSLDTSFNPIPIGESFQPIVLANGNLIGNSFSHQISSYSADGQSLVGFHPISSNYDDILAALPDSGFLVYRANSGILKKYFSNGLQDTSFQSTVGSIWYPNIRPLSNGKILITTSNGMLRLMPNGVLDSTYYFGPSISDYYSPRIQLVDDSGQAFVSVSNYQFQNRIVKFGANGRMDSTHTFSLGSGYLNIAPYPGGWFCVGSTNINRWWYQGFDAFRFNNSGSRIWNKQFAGFNGNIEKIIPYPDKRLLVAGTFSNFDSVPMPYLARLFPDGTLDTSFHSQFSYTEHPNSQWTESLSLGPDGKILGLKYDLNLGYDPIGTPFLLHPDGSIDTSFHLQHQTFGTNDTVVLIGNLFFGPNQKIYAKLDLGKPDPTKSLVVRFLMNGNLDPAFTPRSYGSPQSGLYNGLYPDSDSTFILESSHMGFVSLQGEIPSKIFSLFRIRLDGSVKEGFNFSGSGGEIKSIQSDPSGNLYLSCMKSIGASENTQLFPIFLKIKSDGEEDSLFRSELSNIRFELSDEDLIPFGFVSSAAGEMIHISDSNPLKKLCPNGEIDSSFHIQLFSGGSIFTMTMADSAHIYVAGNFNHINGQPINRIVRLKNYPCVLNSLSEVSKREQITVFPNPGKDNLEISLGSEAKGKAQIRLVDMQGRQVLSQNASSDSENGNIKIQVSGLPKGLYVVQVVTEGNKYTLKWMKE